MRLLLAALASTVHIHVVAAENFWGSLAAQLGGNRVQVTSVITNPATDPHDYEPTAVDARTLRRRADRDRQRRRLRPVGVAAHRSQPGPRPRRPHRRRRRRRQAGRQSAPLVLAGERAAGDLGDRPRLLDSSIRRTRPTSRAQKAQLRDDGPRAVRESDRDDQAAVRRHAGRRVREHLRAARAGARAEAAHAGVVPEGDQRGHGADRGRQDDHRPPDRDERRSRSGSSTARTARPTSQRLTDAARKQGIPVTTITETLTPASATFQAVAGAPAAGARARAGERRCGRERRVTFEGAEARIGGHDDLARRLAHRRARPVRRGPRAERVRASRRSSGPCSDCSRSRPAARPCSDGRRARRTTRIGYLPQRRSFDDEHAHPRRRRRPARARRRPLGPAAPGRAQPRGDAPRRRGDRARRRRPPTRTSRSASSPAASSSGCSSRRRSRAGRSCCCSTSRSTASTSRTRPASPRSCAASAARRTSPCCSSRTTSTRSSATSTASSTSRAEPRSRGRRRTSSPTETLSCAVRRADRGAPRVRRAARRGRRARGAVVTAHHAH